MFFTMVGYTGDYASSATIIILLFRSLVLNRGASGRDGERLALLHPFLWIVFISFSTLGSTGENPGGGDCWLKEKYGIAAWIINIGVAFVIILNLLLVLIISLALTRSRGKLGDYDATRIPKAGMLSVSQKLRDDTDTLTKRLIMYPVIIVLVSGVGILANFLATPSTPQLTLFGEMMITSGGWLSALAFFAYDTSSRKIASALLRWTYPDYVLNPDVAAAPRQYGFHAVVEPVPETALIEGEKMVWLRPILRVLARLDLGGRDAGYHAGRVSFWWNLRFVFRLM
ncbi:hypothetical protein M427DRAFT_152603 [Gonapodya prolifera JEL478]|uniref:G-protein coupled receptors family 2 profile 2 domain-containing protein n=1 Tax=Gonapodya prolifera (strain JEL478) TaxID=1344416 RepID=A0A139AQM8_GONPJ|nr:hypothetical protein M427DRAFT_152603 [Gonapodya prolifera JEL478]|eukprot:KXS19067.1 hypothetical protein M427DRAFT_152603 [Gonapodya prolifera JEL478]